MITNDDKALLHLNSLICAGRDAEAGYLAAADAVAETELVQLFAEFALQRANLVLELQKRVKTLRGDPENLGSVAGEAHRTWIGLTAILASAEAHAILDEVERGDNMSVMAYRDALAERDIDQQSRDLIQRQYEVVQAAHARVRQLRDSATYADR